MVADEVLGSRCGFPGGRTVSCRRRPTGGAGRLDDLTAKLSDYPRPLQRHAMMMSCAALARKISREETIAGAAGTLRG